MKLIHSVALVITLLPTGCSDPDPSPRYPDLGRWCGGDELPCGGGLTCLDSFCTEVCDAEAGAVPDCAGGEGACFKTLVVVGHGVANLCFPRCQFDGETPTCAYGGVAEYNGACVCF